MTLDKIQKECMSLYLEKHLKEKFKYIKQIKWSKIIVYEKICLKIVILK